MKSAYCSIYSGFHWVVRVIKENLQKDVWIRRILPEYEYRVYLEENILKRQVLPLYSNTEKRYKKKNGVFFISSKEWVSGGICDKLRGCISLFSLTERQHLPFYIYWVYPFKLTDYLVPNKYDWSKKCEISRDAGSIPIQMMSYCSYLDQDEKCFQRKRLNRLIHKNRKIKEIHVYTNAHFGNSDFHRIFTILFKPSAHLETLLKEYLPKVQYISLSFRFIQLMGDFIDNSGGEILPEEERMQYLIDSIDLIKKVHDKNKGIYIFIASDSATLIERAKELDYICTIPGKPRHSDIPAENYDKEFLDFFAISRAERVYLCKKGKMYTSGFPYYASLAGGKEFEIIEY